MNRDYYSQYVTEDIEDYISRKRINGCYGNSLELQAISEMFNRPVEVYSNGDGIIFLRIGLFVRNINFNF